MFAPTLRRLLPFQPLLDHGESLVNFVLDPTVLLWTEVNTGERSTINATNILKAYWRECQKFEAVKDFARFKFHTFG